MFTDMFGNDRLKVGLHMHTTRSDGKKNARGGCCRIRCGGL